MDHYAYLVLFTILALFLDVGVGEFYSLVLAFVTLVRMWNLILTKRRNRNRINIEKLFTTKINDLSEDFLAAEVLSRVPVTAMRRIRSVCSNWNTISKTKRFRERHIAQAKSAAARERVLMMGNRMYLMSFNLGIEPSIKEIDKFTATGLVDISHIYHCDGLLLCISRDLKSAFVYNPYFGPIWGFKSEDENNFFTSYPPRSDSYVYAIGYKEEEESSRTYKFLRFTAIDYKDYEIYEYEISEYGTFEYRKIRRPAWSLLSGVSLKGNTYWHAKERCPDGCNPCGNQFLICFDFTSETFGPNLPLPFLPKVGDVATLSCVGEEQLAVLLQRRDTLEIEIWVTSKIEPEVVEWREMRFLSVDMKPLKAYKLSSGSASFFVDEEKHVAVVFDQDEETGQFLAYILGEDGLSRKMDLGESSVESSYPQVCSYVPSLAQI